MEKLTIEYAVGYMLKVMKSGVPIRQFKEEFASIRHGNYFDFLNLIKGPIPFMITCNNGIITDDNSPNNDDCDFGGLLKSGPSLVIFYFKCKAIYGEINDSDISDEIYCKVVIFEIALRMHANNDKLLNNREDLINVINKLCSYKNISQTETDKLQKGRVFLNMIKHNKDQFASWDDGIKSFEEAYSILLNNDLTII